MRVVRGVKSVRGLRGVKSVRGLRGVKHGMQRVLVHLVITTVRV